ncbi:MAG: hypothetical protein JWM31_1090 [Solirubrobacterales bacterium]|nr:hypothetical protein [Solirubrobacterales bacterium]
MAVNPLPPVLVAVRLSFRKTAVPRDVRARVVTVLVVIGVLVLVLALGTDLEVAQRASSVAAATGASGPDGKASCSL